MHSTSTASRSSAMTAASAIAAAIAALTLAACGPQDAGDTVAPGSGSVTMQATSTTSTIASTPQADPAAPTDAAVPERQPLSQSRPVDRSRIGSVQSIEPIRELPQGTGTGAVIGGVLGAVVGTQFGHGLGRAAMTGLGAAGGAVAGNNVERNRHEGVSGYRVSVRLDNGATRTFERTDVAGLQVGDRVHLDASSFHRV